MAKGRLFSIFKPNQLSSSLTSILLQLRKRLVCVFNPFSNLFQHFPIFQLNIESQFYSNLKLEKGYLLILKF